MLFYREHAWDINRDLHTYLLTITKTFRNAVLIKGGVWKNTEDEILKAAVMKYGLNQWARISSLLVRKSAKQCKARWYEWLDPAIKKTEWTREEDEKLLHLAKLMPTQWRTIAPIVGRTPTQCLERYEKLLDMAAGKEGGYDPRDDPRRLRPGEIDPHPETKPARPDAIDMDEDEKEMLSEARARLANTKGKKAKRKAREKQLEEARRLAALQKKRELKAAGIDVKEKVRKGGAIDYAKEVVLERKPAPGFYDVAEEDLKTKELQQEFRPMTKDEVMGRRQRDIQAEIMKNDLAREKMAERNNTPAAIAAALAKKNSESMSMRRGKLMLPAPQVSDAELEVIARHGAGAMEVDGPADAARSLLGDYTAGTSAPTPGRVMGTSLRTPVGPDGANRLILEAQNLARLQQGQTPLLGGDNPELHPSDFSGITPRNTAAAMATPNPLAAATGVALWMAGTGRHGVNKSVAGVSATPSSQAPLPTPIRDALGLNDADAVRLTGDEREAKLREMLMKTELRSGLSRLPAPKNEYQISVPEMPDALTHDDEAIAMDGAEDAEEREARRRAAIQTAKEAEFRRQTAVIQRGLPRPVVMDLMSEPKEERGIVATTMGLATTEVAQIAEDLLNREMVALVQHDNARHPLKTLKKTLQGFVHGEGHGGESKGVFKLERFDDEILQGSRDLLETETHAVRAAMGHGDIDETEYAAVWEAVNRDVMYVPSQGRYMRASALSAAEKIASLQSDFESVRKEMEKEAKRAAKLEQKVGILTNGLSNRLDSLKGDVEKHIKELGVSEIELRCFEALHEQEQHVAPERIEALQALVNAQAERERALQERYKSLMMRKEDLLNSSTCQPSKAAA